MKAAPQGFMPFFSSFCLFCLGGMTMWMFVEPFAFFLVRLSWSKSKMLTSRSPCWIWMLMMISSFLIEVRRYLFCYFASS